MREILFRGKRTYDGKWLYGNLIIDCIGKLHVISPEYFYEDGHHLMYDDDTDQPVFINPITIGQYTGMKDKNGKKIFEGDILQTEDEIVVVEWHKPSASWYSKFVKYLEPREHWWTGILCSQWGEYATVIGNIHDNPEMLKGE